ncbi:MAG: hypothetical protein HY603_00820 [Parcubacteria group bacterium]|nr:hypothetical protein [Parcubacteria group bacterium]
MLDLRIVARTDHADPKLAKQLQGLRIPTRLVNGETIAMLKEKGGQNGSTRWRLPDQFSASNLWIEAAESVTPRGYAVVVAGAEEGNPLPIWRLGLRNLMSGEHALFLGQHIVTITGIRGSGLVIVRHHQPVVHDQMAFIETREMTRAKPEHMGCTPLAMFVPAAREAVSKANCPDCTAVHYGLRDGVLVSHASP